MGFLYLQLILGGVSLCVDQWWKCGQPLASEIVHAFLYPHMLNALLVAGLIL